MIYGLLTLLPYWRTKALDLHRRIGWMVAMALGLQSAAALAKDVSAPVQWKISESHYNCSMAYTDKRIFAFFWLKPTGQYFIRVHQRDWKNVNEEQDLSISVNEKIFSVTGNGAKTSSGWNGFIIPIDEKIFNEVKKSNGFTLNDANAVTYSVAIPQAAIAAQALLDCHKRILASVPPGTKFPATFTKPAHGFVETIVGKMRQVLPRGHFSTVRYILSVDAAGKPTDCKIVNSSGTPEVDATVCNVLLESAKFDPALAEDGTPVPDTYQSAFRLSGG